MSLSSLLEEHATESAHLVGRAALTRALRTSGIPRCLHTESRQLALAICERTARAHSFSRFGGRMLAKSACGHVFLASLNLSRKNPSMRMAASIATRMSQNSWIVLSPVPVI